MADDSLFQPGERITHQEFGQRVVLDPTHDGYLHAFFGVGERRVPTTSLRRQITRTARLRREVGGCAFGAVRGKVARCAGYEE